MPEIQTEESIVIKCKYMEICPNPNSVALKMQITWNSTAALCALVKCQQMLSAAPAPIKDGQESQKRRQHLNMHIIINDIKIFFII